MRPGTDFMSLFDDMFLYLLLLVVEAKLFSRRMIVLGLIVLVKNNVT